MKGRATSLASATMMVTVKATSPPLVMEEALQLAAVDDGEDDESKRESNGE